MTAVSGHGCWNQRAKPRDRAPRREVKGVCGGALSAPNREDAPKWRDLPAAVKPPGDGKIPSEETQRCSDREQPDYSQSS